MNDESESWERRGKSEENPWNLETEKSEERRRGAVKERRKRNRKKVSKGEESQKVKR